MVETDEAASSDTANAGSTWPDPIGDGSGGLTGAEEVRIVRALYSRLLSGIAAQVLEDEAPTLPRLKELLAVFAATLKIRELAAPTAPGHAGESETRDELDPDATLPPWVAGAIRQTYGVEEDNDEA